MNLAYLHSPLYEYLPNPHVFTAFAMERKPSKHYAPPKDVPPSLKSLCSIAIYDIVKNGGTMRKEQIVAKMPNDLRLRTHDISTSLNNLTTNGRMHKRGHGQAATYSFKPITEVPKL